MSTARIPDGTPQGLFQVGPGDVADTSDDWYTPPWVFKAAGLTFDMDVAAPVDPVRRTCPALAYLTPIEDGLMHPWSGLIWMNPPYSQSGKWVDRFVSHPSGLALMHASPRGWLGTLIRSADAIAFLGLVFIRADGKRGDVRWASLLAARGRVATEALTRIAAEDRCARGAYHVRPDLEQIPEPSPAAPGTLL